MSRKLSPIVSEFETETQAAQHDQWFRSKVQASLDTPGQGVAHQVVQVQVAQGYAATVAFSQAHGQQGLEPLTVGDAGQRVFFTVPLAVAMKMK